MACAIRGKNIKNQNYSAALVSFLPKKNIQQKAAKTAPMNGPTTQANIAKKALPASAPPNKEQIRAEKALAGLTETPVRLKPKK